MDERKKNATKTVTKIITYLLFAVLILGLLGGIMYLLNSPSGMYVVYGEENITSENSGITVEWSAEESEVSFTIQNTDDWGAYSVKDCTVKVIPNVSTERDFEFTVDGGTALYSQEDDITAAFVKDYGNYGGNGLTVSEDGVFSLYLIAYTTDYLSTAMPELLSRVYGGSAVTIASDIDILDYAYFALQITSPDGGTVLTVPFRLYVDTFIITYTLAGITSDSSNPVSIRSGESVTLVFAVTDNGYTLPDEITVTGATLDSWNSTTGVAVISNATDNVYITVVNSEIYYTVSIKIAADVFEHLTVSPLVGEYVEGYSVIGYITADESITVTLTTDEDYYISYVTVTNATIYDSSGEDQGTYTGFINTHSYTFTIANPTDDVITIAAVFYNDPYA